MGNACENEEQRLLERVHTEEERVHQSILTQRVHWAEALQKLAALRTYLVETITNLDDQGLVVSTAPWAQKRPGLFTVGITGLRNPPPAARTARGQSWTGPGTRNLLHLLPTSPVVPRRFPEHLLCPIPRLPAVRFGTARAHACGLVARSCRRRTATGREL